LIKLGDYMNIIKYVDEVFSNSEIFHEIECEGTYKESKALEKLCNMKINRERLEIAWSTIISCLIDKYHKETEVKFLTKKTLNFIINNRICLIDLGHLNLKDKWLTKIYKADFRCWEARRTLEERKKTGNGL
jgi:hypothetical protein